MTKLTDEIRTFLNGRRIATIATLNIDYSIHLTAVWYLFEDDNFYLALSSHSRKWKNSVARPDVSIMIDSRIPAKERGVTAIGTPEQITGDAARQWVRKVHERYLTNAALDDPKVGGVYAAGDDVVIKLIPHKWLTWDIAVHDAKNLEGRLSSRNYTHPLDI
jgi:nitroimidazol reductase NimA-like FMN-containing flavoprotein (pyridoxamine 5'-phosphate oxidase superfamily)